VKRARAVLSRVKLARSSFANDQVGRRGRCACRRWIPRDDRLAMIEMVLKRRRQIGVYANDVGADVGEKTPTNGSG
jgi:hypothetical protein